MKMLEGSLVLSATAGTGNAIPAGILDDALRHRVAGTQYHPVASREWSAGLHHSNKFHSHIRPYCLYLSLRPCGWFAGCVFFCFFVRMSTFGERRKDVWEQFQKFTQKATLKSCFTVSHKIQRHKTAVLLHHAPWQALQDARKIEDIILMWTVNFGLNLNETTEEGPRSISVLSLIRDETGQHAAAGLLMFVMLVSLPAPTSLVKYQQHH